MKYAKKFRSIIAGDASGCRREWTPALLSACIIDYVRWKKVFKCSSDSKTIVAQLADDCRKKDALFQTIATRVLKMHKGPSILMQCFTESNESIIAAAEATSTSADDCVRIAELNAETLRKLCKKIDKRDREADARRWLADMHESCRMGFTPRGRIVTALRLRAGDDNDALLSCPICLCSRSDDDSSTQKSPGSWIVLTCGHVVCWQCIVAACHLAGKRGTLHNLLMHCDMACPICRHRHALADMHSWSAWPVVRTSTVLRCCPPSSA